MQPVHPEPVDEFVPRRQRTDEGVAPSRIKLEARQRDLQRSGDSSYDLVLYLQHVSSIRVKLVGPNMRTGLRVDELRVCSHARPGRLRAAFEHVAEAEVLADPAHVDCLPR